jgi:hypothetical protein
VGQTVTGPTGPGYSGVTSTSSVAISTGSKVFVVTSTGAYAIGTRVRAAHTSTPANYVEGLITGLVADTSITVNVDAIGGSGPQSSWTFSVAGNVGATGATGNGISSITRTAGNGAAGTTDTFTITYTSGSTTTFSVYNGSNGTNGAAGRGITSIARTSGTGLAGSTDTYTITYSDASTSTFTVVNGTNGTNGTAATIAVGTVTGLTAGATPTVVNGGSSSAATFNFGIPAGATGSAATIAVGTVTGLAAGATPTVVNGGNSSAATFNFGIPAGATGATGAGYDGITSSTSLSVNTGSKVITVNKIGALAVGTRIRVAYTTSPTTYAEGVITGIATLAVTFLVDQTNGTGTFTSWTVSVAGEAARYTLFASGTVANSATSGSSTLISSADFSGYKNIQLVISALGFSRTPTGRFLLRFNGTSTGYKNLYSNYSSTPSLTGDTSETGYLITNEPVTVTTSTNAQILVDIMNPSLNITTKQVSWQNKNGFGYGTNANIEGPITSMVIATSGNTPDFSWEIYGIK